MAATQGTNPHSGKTTGSWHNTGFHGHNRSKSRLDIYNEFRHLAKPLPPNKFVKRMQNIPSVHSFSKHDNRNSFMNDALYFEQGLGRKRTPGKNVFTKEFLSWNPAVMNFEKPGPKATEYLAEFRNNGLSEAFIPKNVKFPKTSFDPSYPKTTSYRYAHGTDNPNREVLNAMSNIPFTRARKTRAFTSNAGGDRESVATCMSWVSGRRAHTPVAGLSEDMKHVAYNNQIKTKTAPASVDQQCKGLGDAPPSAKEERSPPPNETQAWSPEQRQPRGQSVNSPQSCASQPVLPSPPNQSPPQHMSRSHTPPSLFIRSAEGMPIHVDYVHE